MRRRFQSQENEVKFSGIDRYISPEATQTIAPLTKQGNRQQHITKAKTRDLPILSLRV